MKNLSNIYRDPSGPIFSLVSLIALTSWVLEPAVTASAQTVDPKWTYTGNLNMARSGHTATLLPNGKVLVAGGVNSSGVLKGAELYDPASGQWRVTGSLNVPRKVFTATRLKNGQVLVAGGFSDFGSVTNTAELYDPVTETWTMTGNLEELRAWHSAALLSDGRVLIAGGWDGSSLLNTAEL